MLEILPRRAISLDETKHFENPKLKLAEVLPLLGFLMMRHHFRQFFKDPTM